MKSLIYNTRTKSFSSQGFVVYHEVGNSNNQEGYQITTESEFKSLKKRSSDIKFKKDFGPDSYAECSNWIKSKER